jgi:Kdo2-lipid IVA lauroyltransferase/acyltransferase
MNRGVLRIRKRLSRFSLLWLIRLLRLLVRLLPYRIGVRTGALFGMIAYHLLQRERKRTIAHLSRGYPDKSSDWIAGTARRCFKHLGMSLFEVLMMTPGRALGITEFGGEENIRTALSRGKGVVVVTGHIGNWELMGHAAAARGYTMSVIAAPIEPASVNDIIVGLRSSLGVKTILRSRSGAAKELIRVFKENRLLGILIDQDTDVEGAFVDFMGSPAWTPTAAASMALKFDAPVLIASIKRLSPLRHRVTVDLPDLIRTGDVDRDILMNTAMFTKKLEERIRECPEQWVWMHRRWRRQP